MAGITTDQETTLLDYLAAAGGEEEKPSGPDLSSQEAYALYQRQQERQANEVTKFVKRFHYRPHDGAVAFQNVLMRLFGTTGVGVTVHTFFGDEEPEMIDVPVGVNKFAQIPWGKVAFPIFGDDAYFTNRAVPSDLGAIYELRFTAPKRFGAHIRGLQKEIAKELETNSIYRGKAFDGSSEFIDLSLVDASKVIYSEKVNKALHADLWSLIDHTALMRKLDIPLKHAVLLPGDYGTGKTLIGMVTGQKALAADWTFIRCRPGVDDYEDVMQTARLYQPCVAFFEDVDTFSHTGEDDPLARLLDVYDGATAKGAEIIAVFTTNHPERIHKAMIRPGRIDAVIPVGDQDAESIRRMIEVTVDPQLLTDLDYDVIAERMSEFSPAFIKEAIHRAVRHAIVREGDEPSEFVTEDFTVAADSMQHHLDLMESAQEGDRPEGLGAAFEELLKDTLEQMQLTHPGTDHILMDVTFDGDENEN